jgi:metallo-beta-lactamase family protein
VVGGIEAIFHDAGHVLGASMIKVQVGRNGNRRSILFSGDVGRWDKPILRDPTVFDEADYVLVESTYGDRLHDKSEDIDETLADVINTVNNAGGNVVIPSFALERSQEVLYHLNELLMGNRIPRVMVFVDSPMAVSVTDVFKEHTDLFDDEMIERLSRGESPFHFPNLKMVRTVDESKAINTIRGPLIVIAGSGMCTGGRVKHHLVRNISRPNSAVLFVGYQAMGTLGRHIVDGAREVRILGEKHKVKARIVRMHGFSAHADREELLRWLSGLKESPRKVFVVHGETDAAHSFADHLREEKGWDVYVPSYKDQVSLE